MRSQLFQAALGVSDPWCVQGVDFDATAKTLTISIDVVAGKPLCASGCGRHAPSA